MTSPVSTQQREGVEYALDTARAKTPAERLRIVAEAWEAKRRGEGVCTVHVETGEPYRWISEAEILELAGDQGVRLATKRRPVMVIPALELFEGPMREAPEVGSAYWLPYCFGSALSVEYTWLNDKTDKEWLAEGRVFRSRDAAERIGLHIRNELAKAVRA